MTTIILPAWHSILQDLAWPQTLMPQDVATQGNLTFDMLSYAVEHREAIDAVTQRWDLGLHKFELEDHEWVILKQLCDVLKILKDTTLYFSHAMSICSAVWLANNTLNHYYQLTGRSQTYCISMGMSESLLIFITNICVLLVLHPQHKLDYFKATQ
ncbi:hypothetical protein BDR07DRAFT_1305232 [Suillus spraguei]|nr:hypothetical protein BDR07DRAFT_1305232 [Suillus spraguei]